MARLKQVVVSNDPAEVTRQMALQTPPNRPIPFIPKGSLQMPEGMKAVGPTQFQEMPFAPPGVTIKTRTTTILGKDKK